MVQTKRKYKKKNRKTRRQRGGLERKKGIPLFNDHFERHVPTKEQKCIKSMKKDSKHNMKLPIWIDRLRRQLPKDKQRQWQKAIEDTRWDERLRWCKKNGFCKKGKAWIQATTTKTKKRCIKPPNSGGWCEVNLNLLEWNHCVTKCGRHKSIDSPKLKAVKDKEAKITCNEVRVKIGDKYFSMQDAAQGLVDHNAKIKKDIAEKKAKELAEKKKREAKARKEAEAAIAKAKKLMEEKKAKEAERKRKLKEAEDKRKEKLRKEKEEKKRKEEEHRRKVAEAKAKKEKEKLEKLRKEKEAREEAERKRKEKEAKEEADRIQKLKEKREKEAKAKTKCIADMLKDFEEESEKIIKSVLNGHKNVSDWVDDSKDVEEALKKMAKINDAHAKISKKYNDCFKKINANLPGGPRNELNAKLKKIQDKLMKYFEQIYAVEERIEKEEAEEYKVLSPQNLKHLPKHMIVNDEYKFSTKAPKKCKEKRACDNQLKNKIQSKKGLRIKPEFCIGSVIEGQDLYGSSMSLDYYTGVVIGNAIEKGLPAKYQPGYPAVYYSNYNYGSFPFYSILVKVNKPTKAKIDNFKRWYYKMAKRHGDKPGKYPINTLKAMTKGILTKQVKSKSGKSYSQTSSSKPQPQIIPEQFIKYLPCIPEGQSGGRKKKTRKRSKRGKGKPAIAGKSICVWYGDGNDGNPKDQCTVTKIGPDNEKLYHKIYPMGHKLTYTFGIPTGVKVWSIGSEFVKKIHDIFNHQNIKPVNSDMTTGNYDVYYILYEFQCKYGGERFELMKLTNASVVNNNKKLIVTSKTPKWKDPMEMTQKNKDLHIKWGSKKEVLPVGSLWAIPKPVARRHTIGGRKKRTRRRKKRRRKRTKKRR